MPIVIRRSNLAYFPVPKIACTSIKLMLHEIKTGKPFEPRRRPNGKMVHIHHVHQSILIDQLDLSELEGLRRVAVVRDPLRRLLSAYSNRVINHRELSEEKAGAKLQEADLPTDPDLATFIEHLDRYSAAVGTISHHTRPIVDFLGSESGYYHRIYRFSELAEFAADMQEMTGSTVTLPHAQAGGPKLKPAALSPEQADWLREYYAADYAAFGAYFD